MFSNLIKNVVQWGITLYTGKKYGPKVKLVAEFIFIAFKLIQDQLKTKELGKELDLTKIGTQLYSEFQIYFYNSKPIEAQFTAYLLYHLIESVHILFDKNRKLDIRKAITDLENLKTLL